jgi:hypothetical protein
MTWVKFTNWWKFHQHGWQVNESKWPLSISGCVSEACITASLSFTNLPTYLTTSSFSNSYSLLYFISASTAQEMQKLCGGELLGAALLSSITGWQPLEGAKPYAPRTTLHHRCVKIAVIENDEGLALDFNLQFYSLTKTSHHCHATKALIELFLLTLIRKFNQIDSHPKLQQTNLASHDYLLCKNPIPNLVIQQSSFQIHTVYMQETYWYFFSLIL